MKVFFIKICKKNMLISFAFGLFFCNKMYGAVSESSPTNCYRLIFIGDSITHGVGVSNKGKRYSTCVINLLRQRYPNVIEINLGKSGQALCQQGNDYVESLLAQKPDAVVVQWGVNDDYCGFSVAQFCAAYEHLVAALCEAKPQMKIVLTTLVPDFRHDGGLDGWSGEANIRIQEIAIRYHCQLADVHHALDHNRKSYLADEIHPNDAGAKKMAETIASAFLAQPATGTDVQFAFDQGHDVRFFQFIFMPQRIDEQPHWTKISEFNPQTGDMKICTELPLKIIFPPSLNKSLVMEDSTGKIISQISTNRPISFTVTPVNCPQIFVIKVKS